MSLLTATRSRVLLLLAGALAIAPPAGLDAGTSQAVSDPGGLAQESDGSLRLSAAAGPAPMAVQGFERYGIWDAPPRKTPYQFQSVGVRYRAETPPGTESYVAVRASGDGRRWSEWEWDIADGAVASFSGPQRWLQYRVVLLGQADRTPVVSPIQLTPRPSAPGSQAPAPRRQKLAPTYRLRVTRLGMVGGRTANGHIIKPNDFFVALPSWTVLSSRRGSEYMVRLSANGKSVVVRVADVGPWNRHDNFWDVERERYKDLPVGWPQDHAAYYEKYNNGRSEKGRVRFPSAVDVGDGAYRALGLKGAQGTLDITFLWLGADPGPGADPLNDRPSKRPAAP